MASKGKRKHSSLWVGETLRKHWELFQFGRDQSGGTAKASAAAGVVQGRRWDLVHLLAVQPRGGGLCPTRVGVGTVLRAGGARNGLAGPWCPDRADVSVSNTNSWMAVGPIKDCW